ncbi:MAG TPA: hypothetical protein VG755_05045 [Nannocystaceae bacterium]|nr:hypothetical protein [Nannocystaceae bacterium]
MMRSSALLLLVLVACDRTTAETKTVETKPADTKTVEAKTVEAKAVETKAVDTKVVVAPPVEPPPPVRDVLEAHTGELWNDRAEGLALLKDGSYAVVGKCEPVESGREGEWDACVKLFDKDGERAATARIGGSGADEVFEAVIATPDGGFVAIGAAEVGGAREALAVKLDAQAKTVWQRTWGGAGDDTALAIITLGNGYVVTGSTHRPEQALDVGVWWLDADGKEIRERIFGGAQKDFAHALAKLDDGFVLAGFTGSKGAGKDDAWVLRLDDNGDAKWDRTYGGPAHDGAFTLLVEPSGDLVIAGDSDGRGWIARIDGSGAPKHEARIEAAAKIRALVKSGDVIVGVGTASDPLKPAWLGRFDAALALQSARTFETPRAAATDAIAMPDGGVALVGDWPSMNSNYANFWLCKLDAAGAGCP